MNQFNKIYFNGCSHTAGGGLEIPNKEDGKTGVWPVRGYKKLGLDVNWKHNKEVAYPQRISEELDIEVDNQSIQGGSLQRVGRMFYEYFSNNDVTDTLFFLEQPPGLRAEFWSTEFNDYILVNTNLTTELVLESPSLTGGQRSYESTKYNEDKPKVYEPLKSYYQNLFNPDCKDYFQKEILNFIGIVLFCEYEKINLVITDLTLNDWPFLNFIDKKVRIKLLSILSSEFKYVNFVTHPIIFCRKRNLIISIDLEGIIAGYGGTPGTFNRKTLYYTDGHPSYNGHIKYAKYVTEKFKEWYE
jgi:hypothetical protein